MWKTLDYRCRYTCVGYYNRILLYGWLLKRVYLKTQFTFVVSTVQVFGSIAQVCDINRQGKYKEMEA